MHLRRWPPLSAPALVVQILRAASPSDHEREQTALAALPPGWELAPSDNGRHLSGTAGDGVHLVWERHSEATSITLFRFDPPAAAMRDLQADPVLVQALIWAVDLPGDVIRATRIVVLPSVAAAENMLPSLDFADSDLVSCLIGDAGGAEPEDRARIWSDFRIGPDGFGRLLIAVNGLTGGFVPAYPALAGTGKLPEFGASRFTGRPNQLGCARSDRAGSGRAVEGRHAAGCQR
ncbi:DUF3422 family protein [Hankyongella ginsenosidimutans]|uniref:DUF3422 family protein n=1 Tax=Hankyongella ginsenosidimutans TaxID=1763828 RepID=UPI00248316F4|nr:DUF3422 family protein [Hankyongella ginsenosidimutans]